MVCVYCIMLKPKLYFLCAALKVVLLPKYTHSQSVISMATMQACKPHPLSLNPLPYMAVPLLHTLALWHHLAAQSGYYSSSPFHERGCHNAESSLHWEPRWPSMLMMSAVMKSPLSCMLYIVNSVAYDVSGHEEPSELHAVHCQQCRL